MSYFAKSFLCSVLVFAAIVVMACCALAQTPVLGSMVIRGPLTMQQTGSFNKTGLLAWYDFANANDSHGSFNLTEVGTPTYSGGVVTCSAAGNYLSQTNLWQSFGTTSGNRTFFIRCRGIGSITSGTAVWVAPNTRANTVYRTTGIRARCTTGVDTTSGTSSSLNTWFTVICEFDQAAGVQRIYVNNGPATETTTTQSNATGTTYFGGTLTPAGVDCEISVFAMFTRLLTSDERTFLYNGGNDITYANLN